MLHLTILPAWSQFCEAQAACSLIIGSQWCSWLKLSARCSLLSQASTELKNAGPEPKKFGVADGYLGSVRGAV
jgi:hypothetical protein